MATIDKLIAAMQSADPVEVVFDTLKDDPNAITDLNKQQLLRGEMGDGTPTPSHTFGAISRVYVGMKLDIGRINASILPRMNFFNEGRFYRGFKVLFRKNDFSMYSTDSKSSELQDRYGSHMFGLQESSINELIEQKRPVIQTNFKKKIGL